MHTFQVYRFSPVHLREEIRCSLAYSVKRLLEALPDDQFQACAPEAEAIFLRLLRDSDACDFILHHYLVCALLADDFGRAKQILGFFALRSPRIADQVLELSTAHLGDDLGWYDRAYSLNDLPEGSLQLVAPGQEAAGCIRQLIDQSLEILRLSSPEAIAEIEAFRPLFLLAATSEQSRMSFGGYSSSIAWGAIALSVARVDLVAVLIQVVHELAHQLLFALSIQVPLVYNDPGELYSSPLRRDPRPMDGVVHACFVSARVHEVLRQIMAGPCVASLAFHDQQAIVAAIDDTAIAVTTALPTIDRSARLSGVGERVVDAARRAVMTP